MFTSHSQLKKKIGKSGSSRPDYLQELVNEYQDTKDKEAKYQVLANLANFAYDPINYDWLFELNVIDLFIDTLTENDEKLKEFGIGGLCNLCLEQRNKEYIINNGGIPLIIDCLSSDNEDTLTSAITILIFLLTPPTLEIAKTSILTQPVEKRIKELSKSGNNISRGDNNGSILTSNSIKNLSIILLNNYFNKDLVDSEK